MKRAIAWGGAPRSSSTATTEILEQLFETPQPWTDSALVEKELAARTP